MFWLQQPLPDWTEIALILIYPTIMCILTERSWVSGGDIKIY